MPSRLADRQIRAAAALAAPTLDVRGPASEALGRAGITLPPASLDAEPAPESASAPASGRTVGRSTTAGLTPTVRPFEEAAWPTRRASGAEAAPLSGLTPDERRVQEILTETLDSVTRNPSSRLGGLTYAERKKLESLDLAYIDAELEGRGQRSRFNRTIDVLALAIMASATVALFGLGHTAPAGYSAIALFGLVTFSVIRGGAQGQRRKILLALRELALLVDDAPVSEAVARTDAVIDSLADPASAPGTADRPTRTRS